MIQFLILLIFGYLVGSFSPGYSFGKIIKNIDIRQFGNGNTGATNTYYFVGPVYGFLTALIDILKASLIYYFSLSKLNADLAILPGLAAVFGHIFPFYLRFKGGRGAAPLIGLTITTLLFTHSIFALLLVIVATISLIYISGYPTSYPIRQILKLGALIFPLSLISLPRTPLLILVGLILSASLAFDFLRLFNQRVNQLYLKLTLFAKPKEQARFSGATFLLLGVFLVLWIFSKEIAILSLSLFIVGDTLAPFGRPFLPIRLLNDKTLGGTLAFFAASFLTGLFLASLTPLVLSLKMILAVSILTAFFEHISFFLDDNFFVPLATATILMLISSFTTV
ncbi:MAG: glycerol-3-phosphate acyltransferase [Patescibacteria group bacterium]|nr:glycerol-3-phosphate acyltransferase [Patescibacteria group bacterium]